MGGGRDGEREIERDIERGREGRACSMHLPVFIIQVPVSVKAQKQRIKEEIQITTANHSEDPTRFL